MKSSSKTQTVPCLANNLSKSAKWLAGEGAVVIASEEGTVVAARRLEATGVEQCSAWEQEAEFYGQKTVERRNLPSA